MTKERKIKSNAVTTHEFLHDGNIRFAVPGVGSKVLRLNDVSLENRHQFMLGGAVKRIINLAAIERDTETGLAATPAMKWARMEAGIDHYNSGTTAYGLRAESRTPDDAGLVVQALMRVKGWELDKANGWIDRTATAKDVERKAVLANLRKNPEIIRATAEIKAEIAAANKAANAEDFLAEMEDIEGEDESVETAGSGTDADEEDQDASEEAPL